MKSRGKEAVGVAKDKALTQLRNYAQTGSGSKRKRKASVAKQTKKTV